MSSVGGIQSAQAAPARSESVVRQSIQRCACEAQQPAYQVQARASYRERSTQTAGALSVRTDDGDVVNISFASQSTQSVGSYSATDGNNSVSGIERTSSSSYAVEVSVEGTLDDDEVEDIRKLLSKLASQVHNPNPRRIEKQFEKLDSLESFQFGFEQTQSSSFERAEVIELPPPAIAPEPPPENAPVRTPEDGQIAAPPLEQNAVITAQYESERAETASLIPIDTAPPAATPDVDVASEVVEVEVEDFRELLSGLTASANDASRLLLESQFEQIEAASYERIDIAA